MNPIYAPILLPDGEQESARWPVLPQPGDTVRPVSVIKHFVVSHILWRNDHQVGIMPYVVVEEAR